MTDQSSGVLHSLTENGNAICASRPVLLVILDGVGVGLGDEYDAVARANTPTLDWLSSTYASHARQLTAHGVAVGLPSDGDMGNSEVGHNILGAGRVFDQGAKCVETAINTGRIWQGVWREMLAAMDDDHGTLHLIGLLSDGNVHSNTAHVHAILAQAAKDGVARVRLHVLLDGRDVPELTAERYVEELEQCIAQLRQQGAGDYAIASGGGRMITTMDRYEADWSIVERGWRAHVLGEGQPFRSTAQALAWTRSDASPDSDQTIPPFVIVDEQENAIGTIEDGDAVLFFNFRGDRAMQISHAFQDGDSFNGFDRRRVPKVFYAGMMLYDGDEAIPVHYLVEPESVDGCMSELLADRGVGQFACAETQKFGHVTYFWNGNRSGKFSASLEDYLEIPSDTCAFNERPWMKSAETTDAAIAALNGGKHRFLRINFAGGDMVGHTGDLRATTMAVESIDLGMRRIVAAAKKQNACLVVTADHGNADDMVQRSKDGAPLQSGNQLSWKTSHTLNPVPFVVADFAGVKHRLRNDVAQGGLGNVAATLIELLGYNAPTAYAPSLLDVPKQI